MKRVIVVTAVLLLVFAASAGATIYYLTPGDDTWTDIDDNYATVFAGAGNDLVQGKNRADDLNGEAGADNLQGGDGPDTVRCGEGDDQCYGGGGADVVRDQDGATNGYLDCGDGKNDEGYGDRNRNTGIQDRIVNCEHAQWQLVG